VSLLPTLWEQSGNEHLLKQAILTVLTKVIEAMKENSRQYHSLVVPLIMHAVEPGSVCIPKHLLLRRLGSIADRAMVEFRSRKSICLKTH
jgi:hypothetical protein